MTTATATIQADPDAILGFIGRVGGRADVLDRALTRWAARDDTRPQPEIRQAANTAMDAIDGMLRDLHQMRSRLVGEIRESDDAAGARADALLATLFPADPAAKAASA